MISGELLEQVKLNDISGETLDVRLHSMKKVIYLVLILLFVSQAGIIMTTR